MVLTISTDCSGIEAPLQALQQLNIPYKQLWSSDIDKFTKLTRDANYTKPDLEFTDINLRDNTTLPTPDLYVIGFPCQPYSYAGKRLGTNDKRSNVINSMIDTIENTKPKTFILENVKGFINIQKGIPYNNLIQILSEDYYVYADVYNTKNYGLPQNRERIFIIGIRRDLQTKVFIKPPEVLMKPIKEIIDKNIVGNKDIFKYEHLKFKTDVDYNIVNYLFNLRVMHDCCPTLLTTNNSYIIYELKRNFTINELLQLQGFPKDFKQNVSKTQLIKQIGNSQSVCVLKAIIKELLLCIKN